MVVALNRAQADAAPLDQQIALRTRQAAAIDGQLRKLEDGGKAIDDAERERSTLEELVHTYRTQYEQARMNEDLDREQRRQRQRRAAGVERRRRRPGRISCRMPSPAS